MKRLLFLPLLFALLLSSCKNKKPGILNHSNLTSSFISIDAGKNNTLKTPKGAVIKIAANSFDVPAGTKVNIEIKEAYRMQDILKGGLTTMSNGKSLQSGGMIYFNAAADEKSLDFLKPVGIEIPTERYNDSMKLFKGEVNDYSTVNWVEPQELGLSPKDKAFTYGSALFKANCVACHHPTKEMTGPALAGSRDREPSKDWAYKFVNNVNSMIETDAYAKALLAKYGSKMTQFNLTKWEIEAILDYCDESAWVSTPLPGTAMPETQSRIDSSSSAGYFNTDCGYDTVAVFESSSISILPQDSLSLVDTAFKEYVKPDEQPMYGFSIDQSGWYNIDCFIENNIDEVKDVILTASLKNGDPENTTIYLCIPSRKLLTYGREERETIIFYEDSGKIKLVPGDKAFVFAMSVKKDKLYYGITQFAVKQEQHIIVDMKESTKEKILDAFRRNKLEDVKIDIDKIDIEEFIYLNETDSIGHEVDTIIPKKEMQIIKKNCEAGTDSTSVPVAYYKP